MTGRAARAAVAGGALLVATRVAAAQPAEAAPPPTPQNPSPMVEHTRAHARLDTAAVAGARGAFDGPLGRPVRVLVTAGTRDAGALRLVVHFHGAAFVAERAVAGLGPGHVAAVVNLGPGSNGYDAAFADPAAFDSLLAGAARGAAAALGRPAAAARFARVTLVGFSAGHGAVRAALREPRHLARVDAVLLLDGLHAGYVPPNTVLAAGGAIDPRPLEALERYARAAARGEKRLVVTHSEIFPGTFASTTECADHLLRALGMRRTPVLRWGPLGMQQLSEARAGGFELLGFAGNAAPDHVDHLHAMPAFLRRAAGR